MSDASYGIPAWSSRESLIASIVRHGDAIYGSGNLIWYYITNIVVPGEFIGREDTKCTIKFFTGDMNHGETGLYIHWEGSYERVMSERECREPLLKWLVSKL